MSERKKEVGETLPFLVLLILSPVILIGFPFYVLGATLFSIGVNHVDPDGHRTNKHPQLFVSLFYGITALAVILGFAFILGAFD